MDTFEGTLDNSPHTIESINLTTLIDDCKSHIFSYLDWVDLISVADSNKHLGAAVHDAFQRKYRNATVDIGLHRYIHFNVNEIKKSDCVNSSCYRYSASGRIIYADILAVVPSLALKLLRNFGHLITNLHIYFCIFNSKLGGYSWGNGYSDPLYCMIWEYLSKYCSTSVIKLSLLGNHNHLLFDDKRKPFTGVKILSIHQFEIDHEFPINTLFPNLQTLHLHTNLFHHPSVIRIHLPMLKHLEFNTLIGNTINVFESNDVEQLLILNSHIEKLKLHLKSKLIESIKYDPQILSCLSESFPNLTHLELIDPDEVITLNGFQPIHFEHVEHFVLSSVWNGIPFSFKKLKSFEIGNIHYRHKTIYSQTMCDLNLSPLLPFIQQNVHLTSVKLRFEKLQHIDAFFKLSYVLTNLEEISITLSECNSSSECILKFLKENRAMRKFSITGSFHFFSDFLNAIETDKIDLKIRNRNLEFFIKRKCDCSLIKYVVRKLYWYARKSSSRHEEKTAMELCTFDESLSTVIDEIPIYREYMQNVEKMQPQSRKLNLYSALG